MREASTSSASALNLSVTRWRKHGKDRLYVNDEAGVRVGWVDLVSGNVTVERPELRAPFDAAVQRWRSADAGGSTSSSRPDGVGRLASTTATQPEAHMTAAGTASATSVQASIPTDSREHPESGIAVAYTSAMQVPAPSESLPSIHSDLGLPVQISDPAWDDLALNVPGQAAREQAELELAAQKERGRVGSFLARAFDAKTDERAWRVGAGGEETVGAKLEKLVKHGWHVLHAVPVGERGSDIDHVVIGHGGVYTVNTKTHPGGKVWVGKHQVRVNGHATNYLRNSRFEAQRAEQMLTAAVGFPVMVRPTLVFLTGTFFPDVTIKQNPDGVLILDRLDIPSAFKRAPHRLTAEQVEAVFEQARRSTTWHRAKGRGAGR
jgi:hypothetical protein